MKLRRIIATITVAAVFFLAPSTIPVKAVISVSPCGPFSWLAADTAFAQVIPCPVTGGTSSSAGVAATGGFIGFVALLAAYDFVRRTTCIGDPWGLGGPSDIRLSNCFVRVLVPVTLALVSSNFALGWQNASRSGHRLAEAGTAEPPRVTYAGRAAYEIVRGQ